MELNKEYAVNVISALKVGSFIIVCKINEDSSDYYSNYREKLFKFKEPDEGVWFETLQYPQIEIGKVVLVEINSRTKEWARGIISQNKSFNLSPEIYLIDTQTFISSNKWCNLRICPPKFLQLKLPTYTIHVNINLNTDEASLKNVIELMISKSQYSKSNFVFTPQSVQDNDYSGVLTVNNIPLNKYLKVLLKHNETKKDQKISIFNPLKFDHLKNIFIPRHSDSTPFLDESLVSSYSDLSNPDLFKNRSCDSLDNSSSSTIGYFEDFSNDTRSTTGSSETSCSILPVKQKNNSSFGSSLSLSNLSSCSLNMEHNSTKCLSINKLNECISQNTDKLEESIIQETNAVTKDENKSNVNSISTEVENQDINTQEPLINKLMKKRSIILKQINAESQQNTIIDKPPKKKEIPKNVSLSNDSYVWWSSDDET